MKIRETLRQSLSTFLALPTAVIMAFLLLALGTYALDQSKVAALSPLREFMEAHVFGDAEATSNLLGTIAGGVITITSITFSLLLVALQQSASSMTHEVFDQFLNRRLNQLYFGFFVGMTLFTLVTLATVDPPFNPIFGATVALVLVIAALYILLLLISSTITQMRPTEIIRSIHDYILGARERQLPIIRKTYRSPTLPAANAVLVTATLEGFMTGVDLDAIARSIEQEPRPVEVVLRQPIGAYVAYQDPLAEVRAPPGADVAELVQVVQQAIRVGRERRLDNDPAYGIEQLEDIAWRSISTSQQNPSPGLITIHNLRDILARWATEPEDEGVERIPIVYPDNVMSRLLAAFESLAVVASEAMQHQTYAEIVRAFALTFSRLPAEQQGRVENLILRTLPALGDHVLTAELDDALIALAEALERARRDDSAAAVRTARAALATTIGKLNSRSTRVPGAG